jgi:Mg2+/Co2+ transporter CorB
LIDPYYVPESTSLFSQLKQFQKQGNEVGMVVDEYGSFTGLVTLEDLIEQIVGRLNQEEEELRILVNDDLSITAEGSTSIRELNKFMSWKIPEDGAKTLSGFVIDHLDHFPKGNICLTIDGYAIETMKIRENFIDEVKVSRI